MTCYCFVFDVANCMLPVRYYVITLSIEYKSCGILFPCLLLDLFISGFITHFELGRPMTYKDRGTLFLVASQSTNVAVVGNSIQEAYGHVSDISN